MPPPLIRYNSKGAKVADLQRRLLALGFNAGKVDGIFGFHGFDYVLSRMEKLLGYGCVQG